MNLHLNLQGGDGTKEGAQAPQTKATTPKIPQRGLPRCKAMHVGSLLESWSLPALVWGQKCSHDEDQWGELYGLFDNGMQINTIMPSYVRSCSLEVGPITNLLGRWVTCIGLGNAYTQPLGYVIIQVQVDGVQGYNEGQIALVVPDLLNFVSRIPIILGTPTISHITNVMKEREIDTLATPWANARVAHLLSAWRDAATVEDNQATEESGPSEYDEVVITKNTETVDDFSSCVTPVKV